MTSQENFAPSRVIPLLAETHMHNVSIRSQVIYTSILVSVVLALASLPFIYVTVSVKSPAIIRPAAEVTSIRSLVTGKVKESFLSENMVVKKGQVLFTIDADMVIEKHDHLSSRAADLNNMIHDLHILLNPAKGALSANTFKTSLYRQSWLSFSQRLTEVRTRFEKVQRDFNRNHLLHQKDVISDAEMENFKFSMDDVKNELEMVKISQLNQWQSELKNYQQELKEYETQLYQLEKDKNDLVVKAPVSGSIQNVAGIYPGSSVFVNQEIATLSPDTSMVVEAYVTPSDIGLIKKGMSAVFQVDAFNYNQWGLARGQVIDISQDVHMIREQPVFKIKCSLDKNFLQLTNGYKGYLQKGMSLQARFVVADRSLWQLLYDHVDDWLNPNLSE